MGTREAGFASSMPGLSQVRERDGSRGTGRLWNVRSSAFRRTRARLSRHHRSGAREEDPRPVDHRDQPDGVVPRTTRR
jgi:hypothetical protein